MAKPHMVPRIRPQGSTLGQSDMTSFVHRHGTTAGQGTGRDGDESGGNESPTRRPDVDKPIVPRLTPYVHVHIVANGATGSHLKLNNHQLCSA